jgi:hypothetical protein
MITVNLRDQKAYSEERLRGLIMIWLNGSLNRQYKLVIAVCTQLCVRGKKVAQDLIMQISSPDHPHLHCLGNFIFDSTGLPVE